MEKHQMCAQDFSSPVAGPFDFPEGKHGVLLIHGFTGSPAHMRPLGDALRARGYAVRGNTNMAVRENTRRLMEDFFLQLRLFQVLNRIWL